MSDEKRDEAVATAPTTTQTETPDKPITASSSSTAADPVMKGHAIPNGDTINEKEAVLQQETTHSDARSPNDLKHKLTLHETIDLENKQAFKGDDSEGKIEWTVRKINPATPYSSGRDIMNRPSSSLLHPASWPCFTQVWFTCRKNFPANAVHETRD